MAVQVLCSNPKCAKSLSVSDELVGRTGRCPYCGTTFQTKPSRAAAGGKAAAAATPSKSSPDVPRAIGPYTVTKKLGQGAFGVVYKGSDPALGRDVAIKVLRPETLASAKYVDRFLREAKLVGQMLHGNIVPVFQLGQHHGGYFIASAFIPGKTLSDLIPEQGMDLHRAVSLVVQLLDALAYAHDRGILHRDVKPANAMVDEKDKLFLMDFGLGCLAGQDEGRATQDGTVLGTPAYMPPEQARGAIQQIGPASDQYSAGVVLYELLTGHLPFEGAPQLVILHNVIHTPPQPPSTLRAGLDSRLEEICLRSMAKLPGERFASCDEFASTLRAWLGASVPVPTAQQSANVTDSATRQSSLVQTTSGASKHTTENVPRPQPLTVEAVASGPVPTAEPLSPGISRRSWLLLAGAVIAIPVVSIGGFAVKRMMGRGNQTQTGGERQRGLSGQP